METEHFLYVALSYGTAFLAILGVAPVLVGYKGIIQYCKNKVNVVVVVISENLSFKRHFIS